VFVVEIVGMIVVVVIGCESLPISVRVLLLLLVVE
jgi:hypothetical protein